MRLPERSRGAAVAALLALAVLTPGCALGPSNSEAGQQRATAPGSFSFPTLAGINYGEPQTVSGRWAGTRWLRSGPGSGDYWTATKPVFDRDLGRIEQQHVGSVIRVFVGLDQLMSWDEGTGYAGFVQADLDNFAEALGLIDQHHLRAIVVLYDQEEVVSPGNFHFEALDGAHPQMRAGYLAATEDFMRRFGSEPMVLGWDLFNEAYASLGDRGGLAAPPAPDPVSPGYSTETVHAWLRDLYAAAKRGAPHAWLTVSDTTDLYWRNPPDTSLYEGAVDFYDIHVYDDRPAYPRWRATLPRPYIIGEAGAGVAGDGARDPQVLSYLLDHAAASGVTAVLAQPRVLTADGGLTPTGEVLAQFVAGHPHG